LFKKSAT